MSLKQSIVIRNEFTCKQANGSGTRGSTPGNYVLDYMAREGAGEAVAPIRYLDADEYITRYMLRDGAVDKAVKPAALSDDLRHVSGLGGQAFGNGSASLSHEDLRRRSKEMQRQFDQGKTVMKTVLSFTEDYLKENQILDPDFVYRKPGDYRGQLDQMRMRLAIMNGLDRMSRHYDNLQYVGVIQVDTAHVHCHLVMADFGPGRLAKDGTQVGCLSGSARRDLRRGMDLFLDQNQKVQQLSADVGMDRRNVTCYLKQFTHRSMEHNGVPQFLFACLPEDERLWRAKTNRREMQKPNAIVRDYVTQVFAEPGSGYGSALRSIDAYAKERMEREGLSLKEYRQLYQNGQEKLVQDSMNAVYSVLRQVPKSERTVRTPMLDAMGMDYEQMAKDAPSDPMVEFGFKLRSYSSRLDHHRKETHKYERAVEDYQKTPDPDPSSAALLAFFQYEQEYHAKLMCKYQHFLGFLPPGEFYEKEFKDLLDYRKKTRNLMALRQDASAKKMLPDHAEEYGRKVYGQHGGRFLSGMPGVLDQRILSMQDTYQEKKKRFRSHLADRGLSLVEDPENNRLSVSRKKPYSFDEVKALDVHHLGYDFPGDLLISVGNRDVFVEAAAERYEKYKAAEFYLKRTGQEAVLEQLPGRDVRAMKETADRLSGRTSLSKPSLPESAGYRRSAAPRLDWDCTDDMRFAVRRMVAATAELSR